MSPATPYIRDDAFTVIVFIDIEPGQAQTFIDRVHEMITSFTRHQPGFVSSSIHRAEDGTRLLNYSQWEDRQAFEAFRDEPEGKRHIADLEKIAIRLEAVVMPPEFIIVADE